MDNPAETDPQLPPTPVLSELAPVPALPSSEEASEEEKALSGLGDPDYRKSLRDNDIDLKKAKTETVKLNNNIISNENTRLEFENWRLRLDIGLRILACIGIPSLLYWWLGRVICVVETQQKVTAENPAKLSDATMVALLSASSVTVIGLLSIVVRYLFRESKSKE